MHASDLIRWVFCVLLGLLGSWIVVLNFVMAYRWYARRESHSFVPLVGGFVAFLGMGLCPLPAVRRLAWVPFAVDAAYVVFVITFGFGGMMLRRLFGGKKEGA